MRRPRGPRTPVRARTPHSPPNPLPQHQALPAGTSIPHSAMAVRPRSISLVELRDRLLASAKNDHARLTCAAMLEGFSLGADGCARVMAGEFAGMLKPRKFREAMYAGLDERDRAVLPSSLPVRARLTAAPKPSPRPYCTSLLPHCRERGVNSTALSLKPSWELCCTDCAGRRTWRRTRPLLQCSPRWERPSWRVPAESWRR